MDNKIQKYLQNLENVTQGKYFPLKEKDVVSDLLVILKEAKLIEEEELISWEKRLTSSTGEEIGSLDLSTRAFNSLARVGVNTYQQLRKLILYGELLKIRNVGISTAIEISACAIKKNIIALEELKRHQAGIEWDDIYVELDKKFQ